MIESERQHRSGRLEPDEAENLINTLSNDGVPEEIITSILSDKGVPNQFIRRVLKKLRSDGDDS
ncbi:hypothetical protein D3C84_1259970 [compost metagenome]